MDVPFETYSFVWVAVVVIGLRLIQAAWRARPQSGQTGAAGALPLGPKDKPQYHSTWVKRYGLPKDASWDDIYDVWKRQWAFFPRNALRTLALASVLPACILLVSQTLWAWIAAAALLTVGMALLSLGWALAMEQEYWGWLLSCDEIRKRAVRDGYFSD